LLDPGIAVEAGVPNIAIIGGIGVADINILGNGYTTPGALFALTGNPADEWLNTRECPFGGLVTIQGYPSVGDQYRIRVHDSATGADFVLKDPFWTVDQFGFGTYITPDPTTGYVSYLPVTNNIDNVLGWWYTTGNDLWQVRLEILRADLTTGTTVWYNVQLDNTPIAISNTLPGIDIHIDSGGDCKDVIVGGSVNGHFFAQDLNFGAFSLWTEPNTPAIPSNQPTTTTPATSPTAAWPGDPWALSTTTPVEMEPCGYVVNLAAWDLTIVGSEYGSHHSASTAVGFCLRAGG